MLRNSYNLLQYDELEKCLEVIYTTTDGAIVSPRLPERDYNNKIVMNAYCNGVGKLIFAKEITSIPAWFLSGCDNLKSIVLPPTCKVIHDHAFFNCRNLESVKLGGVRVVKEYAFAGTGLKKIRIPPTCFYLSSFAFYHSTLQVVKLNTPTAAYRYFDAYAFGKLVKMQGISKYDDFSQTAFG